MLAQVGVSRDLYERCLRGEEEAWRVVHLVCLKAARWPGWNLGEEAKDLAQDVVLSLVRGGIHTIKEPSAFLGFVRRAARNAIIDHLRRRGATLSDQRDRGDQVEGADPEAVASEPTPEQVTVVTDLTRRIQAILADLGERCRRIIELYIAYQKGFLESYQEMARRLDLPLGTLSVQIKRCLERLRSHPTFSSLEASWRGSTG